MITKTKPIINENFEMIALNKIKLVTTIWLYFRLLNVLIHC